MDDERDGDVRRQAPTTTTDSGWSEGSGGRSASPWALAMRLSGVLLEGNGRRPDARLGGIGVSGRFAVNPVVTLDLGLDSILGTDYNGYDRSELSLSFSSLFYLNYHPVLRTYVLVGLNTSRARVDIDGDDQSWGYFGGQTGFGLDISLDSRIALKSSTSSLSCGGGPTRAPRESPEFTDAQGRVTNTSGGGLLPSGHHSAFLTSMAGHQLAIPRKSSDKHQPKDEKQRPSMQASRAFWCLLCFTGPLNGPVKQ